MPWRNGKNKAQVWYDALTDAIELAGNDLLKADLEDMREKLGGARLQWAGGGRCVPNQRVDIWKQRFLAKTKDMGYCIEWQSNKNRTGYGQFIVEGETWLAHRYSYFLRHGQIPEGKLVLHKCDNPACVNVDHLYAGSYKDNSRDMLDRKRNFWANKTHCIHGHEYTEENTVRCGNRRACKECARIRSRARTKRLREEKLAAV